MSIIDRLFRRQPTKKIYVSHKAKRKDYPEWALLRAGVESYGYPDYAIATKTVDFYTKVSWVNIAVNHVATIGSSVKWNVKRIEGENQVDIPNHDFERRMKAPNPVMSEGDLIFATLAYLDIGVPAYWWLNMVGNSVAEIWLIPSKQISPIPDENMYIKRYDYDPGDGNLIPLTVEEIVPFVGFSPDSMFETFSGLEPLRTIATTDVGMQNYNKKLYIGSSGRLPGILAYADPIGDDDWEIIHNDIRKAAAANPKDMETLKNRLDNRDEIWAYLAPGLASLLSINASLDNARTGKSTLIDLKIYPLLKKIGDVITNRIMPLYGENLICEPEDIRITDKVLLMQEIKTYSETHTVDEVREKYWQSDPLENETVGEMLVSAAQSYKETPEPPEPSVDETPAPVYEDATPPEQVSTDEQNPQVDDMETRAEFQPIKADIYPAMLELEKWERKVQKANGKPVKFISYNIPADVVEAVKAGMSFADARLMLQGKPATTTEQSEVVKRLDTLIEAL